MLLVALFALKQPKHIVEIEDDYNLELDRSLFVSRCGKSSRFVARYRRKHGLVAPTNLERSVLLSANYRFAEATLSSYYIISQRGRKSRIHTTYTYTHGRVKGVNSRRARDDFSFRSSHVFIERCYLPFTAYAFSRWRSARTRELSSLESERIDGAPRGYFRGGA